MDIVGICGNVHFVICRCYFGETIVQNVGKTIRFRTFYLLLDNFLEEIFAFYPFFPTFADRFRELNKI